MIINKIDFLKKLNFIVNKRKGNDPFLLEDIMKNSYLINKYKSNIDQLIQDGFFFLKKLDNGKYEKTYRIEEVCDRTIKELEKEDINSSVLEHIKANPLILHLEFKKWLDTKHNSMLSYILDKYWHNFILYSNEYHSWCYDNYNRLVHHLPTPYYEKAELTNIDAVTDNIEFLTKYLKQNPMSKNILIYKLPYKLLKDGIEFDTIENIILDLVSE